MKTPSQKTIMVLVACAVAAVVAWLTFRSRSAFAANGAGADPFAPPASPFAGLGGGGWSGGGGGYAGGTFTSMPVAAPQAAPEHASSVLATSKAEASKALEDEGVRLASVAGIPLPTDQKHGEGGKAYKKMKLKGKVNDPTVPTTLPTWIAPPPIVGDGADSERAIAHAERVVTRNNDSVFKTVEHMLANPKPKPAKAPPRPTMFGKPMVPPNTKQMRADAAKAKAKAVAAPPSGPPPTGGGPVQVVSHAPVAYKGNDPKGAEQHVTKGAGAF